MVARGLRSFLVAKFSKSFLVAKAAKSCLVVKLARSLFVVKFSPSFLVMKCFFNREMSAEFRVGLTAGIGKFRVTNFAGIDKGRRRCALRVTFVCIFYVIQCFYESWKVRLLD